MKLSSTLINFFAHSLNISLSISNPLSFPRWNNIGQSLCKQRWLFPVRSEMLFGKAFPTEPWQRLQSTRVGIHLMLVAEMRKPLKQWLKMVILSSWQLTSQGLHLPEPVNTREQIQVALVLMLVHHADTMFSSHGTKVTNRQQRTGTFTCLKSCGK